jgi:hypothetical protein
MQAEWQSQAAIKIKRALAGGTCFTVMALCIGTSAPAAHASDRALVVNACWEYKLFRDPDIDGAIETKLAFSHLICFHPRGRVTGVTFHAHDACDWIHRYKMTNHATFFDDEVFGHVLSVDPHRMVVAVGDEQRTYRYVCRTTAENIQCDRLRERRFRR